MGRLKAARVLLVLLLPLVQAQQPSRSPYSLQSAVDALHHREAQLALRDYLDLPPTDEEPEYWPEGEVPINPPFHGSRRELNKMLANYLSREEEDERDDRLPVMPNDQAFAEDSPYEMARKRSIFREREDELPYQTVFREREMDAFSDPSFAQDFLGEIERENNAEREEKYKEALRRLWEKYQQQENEIERALFEDRSPGRFYESRKTANFPAMYAAPIPEKRRTFPALPWLPASRKKRFPVSKRSPAPEEVNVSGTDEKVVKDLQGIFGDGDNESKKKRSSDTKEHSHDHDHDHSEEHHDHENHQDHEDEPEDDKKKKRAADEKKKTNLEVVKDDQIIPGDLIDETRKKSIQWSKYFGIDRKKKSGYINDKYKSMMKKAEEYPLQHFRVHDIGEQRELQREHRDKKQVSEDKLENMDQKLKNIEDLIIDETIKYTGAHEGISDPEDIQRLKDHVISRLATAYSLEKMRKALERLKDSVEAERHLMLNEIEPSKALDKDKDKRVAVKKEKVDFENKDHKIESATEKVTQEEPENGLEKEDVDNRKKKRTNINRYDYPIGQIANNLGEFEEELGAGHSDLMADPYSLGGGRSFAQCPLVDAIERRCRGVDLLSGDLQQDLLSVCLSHQLCYICGTSLTACDFQYLAEADSMCNANTECQSAARSALMILRGNPGPQLGPRECSRNPCLSVYLRDIGY
ncbi:zinc finger CCCH domain-containing protein 13 [Phlebotomus argentipes]|uniref:zinc finger CCCH domain-containing protein 13 n=1 Tax=Phlebotomus argentipes TaxID=94469 RepID=UPI0028931942|nr:zinc finger CCCH domain-containing protein 13 [Phlebotomus argentipes]